MSRVDADIDALKGLLAALSRFGQAGRDVLDRARYQSDDALAALAERVARSRAELEEGGSAGGGSASGAAERHESAVRWQQRVDEQAGVYQVAADRFAALLETGLPRAQASLAMLIASLEAARTAAVAQAPAAPARTSGAP